ncbi:MAG: PCMD domain-containing protein [Alistipes sp.]|nr:PCMD domain-containing protein [Alistipes sp.]
MKTILKYIFLAAVALIVAACQEGLDQISTDEGMGNVKLNISTNEHTRVGENFTPEELRVRIYDEDGRLVRIYTEDDVIPENIALVAGKYTFKVEARDNDHTTKFKGSDVEDDREKIYYIGEDDVTVTAGGSVTAEVDCDPQHVRVGVILDEDEGENEYLRNVGISLATMSITEREEEVDNKTKEDFDDAYAEVLGADRLDFGTAVSGSTVSYEGEDYAYFLMPEGVSTISWVITGEHVAPTEDQPATAAEGDSTEGSNSADSNEGTTAPGGVVTQFDRAGQIVVKAGTAYELQFRYSQLPDGSITIDVEVDETVETFDEQITFKPEPEIIPLAGNTWIEDEDNDNVYVVGTSDISFNVTSINKIDGFGLNEEKLWDKGNYVSEGSEMITVTPIGDEGKEFKVTVKPEYFATLAGGEQDFRLSAYDGMTEVGKFRTTFLNQGLTKPTDIDLWLNTAKFNAVVTQTATSVVVKFRKVKGTGSYGDWVTVDLSNTTGNVYGGTSVATWSEGTNVNSKTIYTPDSDKSIFANGTYEYQLVVDGSDYGPSGTFTTTVEQPIPYADFESSSLSCWGQNNSSSDSNVYWGSGNNFFKDGLCLQANKISEAEQSISISNSARLKASETLGMLAAGNIFTGTFDFNMSAQEGTVSFGVNYNWVARPTAMKVKVWHKIGNVTTTKYAETLPVGTPDQASIQICVIDWNNKHQVTSGRNSPTGVWSPENGMTTSTSAGSVIGYGVVYPTGTTEGSSMAEITIPIQYYDKTAKPEGNYKLIISAATSRYGDYMNGCNDNVMYVDDFQWVY